MLLCLFKDGKFETLYKDIRIYSEFAILHKYKGFEFEQLFKYIYFICDRNSYPNKEGLSDKERREYALRNSGLPTNFKDDTIIKMAMGKYGELTFSTVGELAKTLSRSINNTYKLAARLECLVNELLETLVDSPLGEELSNATDDEDRIKLQERINKYRATVTKDISSYNQQIFELADKTDKYLILMKKIQDEADKIEVGGGNKLLGGGNVEASMTSNNPVEGNDISNADLIVS